MSDIISKTVSSVKSLFVKYPPDHKEPPSVGDSIIDFLHGKTIGGYNMYNIWLWKPDKLEWNLEYINYLFPVFYSDKLNKDTEAINNIKKSFLVMLRFYGWEVIDDNVFRTIIRDKKSILPDKPMKWFSNYVNFKNETQSRPEGVGSANFKRIDRMFECFNQFGLERESTLLFLALCKTYANYGDKIGESEFRKWLSYQSFWIPQHVIDNYKININKGWDLRYRLLNLALTRGNDEQLTEYLQTLITDYNITQVDFIENVKNTPVNKRQEYIYELLQPTRVTR